MQLWLGTGGPVAAHIELVTREEIEACVVSFVSQCVYVCVCVLLTEEQCW